MQKLLDLLISKQTAMFKRALYLCKNKHDAEDLLNDANLKLLIMINNNAPIYDNAPGAYFQLAVDSVFIDRVRKKKIDTVEAKENNCKHFSETGEEKISAIHISDIMEKVNIPLQDRQIVEFFLMDINMNEFADANNLVATTIRRKISRAKKLLYDNRFGFEHLKNGFDLVLTESHTPGEKKNRKLKAA